MPLVTPQDLITFSQKAAGIIGWSDQGQNDMRALPMGGQTFAGVPFTVGAPRSAVVLYSTTTPDNQQLPNHIYLAR